MEKKEAVRDRRNVVRSVNILKTRISRGRKLTQSNTSKDLVWEFSEIAKIKL